MADEHVRRSVVRGLRDRGIDTRTVRGVGLGGASDDRLLEVSLEHGWLLLTNDDDLLRLAHSGTHAGIIFQTTQFVDAGELLRAVVRLVDTLHEKSLRGSVFYVP